MVEASGQVTDEAPGKQYTDAWTRLGLDARILKALKKKGHGRPTVVQSRAIPLVLSGKDVVARAHTGSGKTLAYVLPMIHKILQNQDVRSMNNPRALVLVPTRELAQQVKNETALLLGTCAASIRAGELPGSGSTDGTLSEFAGAPPEIVVSTPARVVQCIHDGLFPPGSLTSNLELLVLDEADLLLSYGYQDDIRYIAEAVQRGCQCMLLSATFKEDFLRIGALVLHNPVHLNVEDVDKFDRSPHSFSAGPFTEEPRISHFTIEVRAQDKLLYCMALLRLGLCERKTLIFVMHPDTAIRLRIFLDKFGISCCAFHDQLPANSRSHVLQEFNRGIYDSLIAVADDAHVSEDDSFGRSHHDDDDDRVERHILDNLDGKRKKAKKKGGIRRNMKPCDSGVGRGIDFKQVRTVINFDTPLNAASYLHRIGRTGRAGEAGTAITFISETEENRMKGIHLGLLALGGNANNISDTMRPFERLAESSVEALRYRAEDAARTVGRTTVREARVREIQAELLNSERLAAHFEENPEDLSLLKHDISLSKQRAVPYLSHLPSYLRSSKNVANEKNRGSSLSDNSWDPESCGANVEASEYSMRKRSRKVPQSRSSRRKNYGKEKTKPKLKV